MTTRPHILAALVLSIIAFPRLAALEPAEVPGDPGQAPDAVRDWFRDAKFGLFIHWGVYSLLGKGEWVMNNDKIPISEYEKLPAQFNPTEFDPEEWVSIAKHAGQKYITITSKHHDGFCMWHTKETRYNIVEGTPYQKDVLRMLSDECKKEGIKLFFYHSHLDWHHPDYFPRGGTGSTAGRPDVGEWEKYLEYLNKQITELCSPPYEAAGIWFDGWWDRPKANWQLAKTYGIIHKLRPNALIGNNHHVAPFTGEDFQMFEQDLPGKNSAGFNNAQVAPLPLETCRTINNSWGYNKDDKAFRPLRDQIRYLVETVGLGANLLLNVGPMPNGKIPPEAVEILLGMGKWLEKNGEAIYGTRPGPWGLSKLGYSVRKGRRAYFHLLKWPKDGTLVLPPLESFRRASILNGERLQGLNDGKAITITLPESARDPIDTIVVIDSNRDLDGINLPFPASRARIEGDEAALSAVDAQATGKIRFEEEPKNALGFWSDPKDQVSWLIEAPAGGDYDVEITYACDKGSGGSDFEVACGSSKAGGKVQETGDWASFRTIALGTLQLPTGASEITVRARSKPSSAQGIMNLRQLKLEKGFVSLFDRKSLDGWQGATNGYAVENGVLYCIPEKGGNLYTKNEFGDFVIRFEFRLPPGGNNGLGIRAPLQGDAAYVGMEIQILDDGDPMYKDIQPWQHHGSIYGVVPAKPGHLRPVGEWNTEEVKAKGRQVTVKLNGVTIVDANLDDVKDSKILEAHPGLARPKGFIGFLGHGHKVEFRNIRLKSLERKAP
jgi:alpha-L-fucosidase